MVRVFALFLLIGFMAFHTTSLWAQSGSQEKSAKVAAMSDTRFIVKNIEDNQSAMSLSQNARERATNDRVRELAEQMADDHTGILYEFEQIGSAGAGSSNGSTIRESTNNRTAEIYGNFSRVSRGDFDSVWVANLLILQQEKYDELLEAVETVTNPQLKMIITRAIPFIRKHVSQLRSLQKSLIKMAIQKRKEATKKTK